jgi:NadR type nicotinamide-nucleotide adenylyltransferase
MRSKRPLVVVVTGSECTGKTTLARELATHYQTTWSPEFARSYLEQKGAPLTAADLLPVAHGQCQGEDRALEGAQVLTVRDTDLFSTVLYARHYYGACPREVETAALERRGHLYLLCHPDVPWSKDGLQRDRGDRREEMHALFVSVLREFGAEVVDIEGPWPERQATALAALDSLLAAFAPRPA